jgi:hypothetical protein
MKRHSIVSIFVLLFLSQNSFAVQCPELTGEYHCVLSNQEYSLLKIDQKLLSEPNADELVEYSFDYISIPGDPDKFYASVKGEYTGDGWITYCLNNRLHSVYFNGSMVSEIYLDEEKALTRTLNYVKMSSCPKKIEN